MDYRATFSLAGRVESVGETQTLGKGFRVRKIMIDTSPGASKYANPVEVRLHGDRVILADSLAPGMDVEVSGYVDGRYANSSKDGRQLHFTTLAAMKVTAEGAVPEAAPDAPDVADPDGPESLPF